MALNQFEKDLRNKMNEREIMPSNKAWDRLDAMLTVAEEKKSKRSYGWLYIAASILGFLFIGTVFFSQTEELIDKGREDVVIEEVSQPSDETTPEKAIVPQTIQENIASSEPQIKTNQQNQRNQSPIKINQSSSIKNPVEAVNEIQKQELIASANQNHNQQSVINQNQSPKIQLNSPTVKVDELLASVQNQQVNPKTSVKVNAKSLLSEVDHQASQSFREKVLRRAGEVAESVYYRNNE